MFVKRGAFLLLTSVLAHQACVVDDSDDDESATGGDSGEGGSSGASGSGGKGGSGGSQAGQSGEAGEGGTSAGAGGDGGGQAGETSGGMGGEAGDTGGAGGEPGCDDSVGSPGDCSAIDSTECSWEYGYCETAGLNLKPAVAEAAVACMLETPDCNDFPDYYGCVRTALAGACPDPTKDAFCADAVTTCGPNEALTSEECHALVDGLNEAGLALVASCVDDGCSFGLWSCVEGVQ